MPPPLPPGARLRPSSSGGDVRLEFSDAALASLARQIESRYSRPKREAAQALVEQYAQRLFDLVLENIPVDTGNLKSSIRLAIGDLVATVYTDVTYAVFVELGTRSMPARPVFQQAFLQIAPDLFRDLQALLSSVD